MIDIDAVRRYATTALMLAFLLLWQLAERKQAATLRVAAIATEATQECVATYRASADQMGAAVAGLMGLRGE